MLRYGAPPGAEDISTNRGGSQRVACVGRADLKSHVHRTCGLLRLVVADQAELVIPCAMSRRGKLVQLLSAFQILLP